MTRNSHQARLRVLCAAGLGAMAGVWSASQLADAPDLIAATLDCTSAAHADVSTLSVEYTSLSALEDAARREQALHQAAIAVALPAD